jgi:hypothetical protein
MSIFKEQYTSFYEGWLALFRDASHHEPHILYKICSLSNMSKTINMINGGWLSGSE